VDEQHAWLARRRHGALDADREVVDPMRLWRHAAAPVEIGPSAREYTAVEPTMERYSRHVLVCTGGFCSPNRGGRELYALLPELLEREGLLFGPGRVKRGETPCLGVCAGGPIIVVYPDGVWYAGVTPALLNRIVTEHLRDGRVVDDAVFFRL